MLDKTWVRISSGEFMMDDGLVYSITEPLIKNNNTKLLVIFSSIANIMYTPYLFRYFEQNYASVQKYICPNTAILRIADIGGVTGAYYLNNKYLPDNEVKIQNLIKNTAEKIGASNVNLFGVSKGASGALYHGIVGNYNFLSVDPIVDDEYYISKHNDLHFVIDTFDISKKDKFQNLINNMNYNNKNNGCIIFSPRSQQFPYINNLLFKKCNKDFSFFITDNPNIKHHPDVAPKSMPLITTLINCLLNDINIERKAYNFI